MSTVAAARQRHLGLACGVVVILLFSSFTLVSRLGFSSSLRPLDVAALRFATAGTLMLPLFGRHGGMAGVRWRDALALAFTGGLGFALLAYAGFALAPAAHAAVLLHGTLPLFTFVLALLTSAVSLTRRNAVGFATIFLGILAMAWDSVATGTPRQLLGDGALLLASLSWSAYGLLARRVALPPARAAAIVAVLSMSAFLPVYLCLPGETLSTAPLQQLLLQGVFQGVLIGVCSVFVYTQAVASLGAVTTALFTAAVPVVTTLGAVLLLGEHPGPTAWAGVVVVTLGMAIALGRAGSAR